MLFPEPGRSSALETWRERGKLVARSVASWGGQTWGQMMTGARLSTPAFRLGFLSCRAAPRGLVRSSREPLASWPRLPALSRRWGEAAPAPPAGVTRRRSRTFEPLRPAAHGTRGQPIDPVRCCRHLQLTPSLLSSTLSGFQRPVSGLLGSSRSGQKVPCSLDARSPPARGGTGQWD